MPRSLALISVLALVLALTACGEREEPVITTESEPQFQITGTWAGELRQQGRKPFRVEARIVSLERSKHNTVRYTGIDCAGSWDYLGAGTTAYRFRELINRGASKQCKGKGLVELTPLTQNSVGYLFRGGGVKSEGRLDRQPAPSGGSGAGQQGDGSGSGSASG
jgi:hypothetical protein